MKKTWIQIKVGLVRDPKHRERMGKAVWLYLHMLDRIDWETGIVYGWRDKLEAEDMSMQWRTLQQWRQQLDELNYITCVQKGNVQDITVHKWCNPREYSGKTYNPISGGTTETVPISGKGTTEGTVPVPSKHSTPSLYSEIKDHIIIKEQELNIWDRVKKAYELQETGNQGTLQVYRKYIEPSEFICEKNNGDGITEFMVRCDNREQHDWLVGRFSSTAKRLLMGYYNTPADNIRLRFVFEE